MGGGWQPVTGRRVGLLLVGAAVLWGGEYARRGLWEPDEARYASVAQEIRDDGHLLAPHRHGEYYSHKPSGWPLATVRRFLTRADPATRTERRGPLPSAAARSRVRRA